MWLSFTCLCLCCYLLFAIVHRDDGAWKKAKAEGRSKGIHELSTWDLVKQIFVPLSIFSRKKPSYKIAHEMTRKYGTLILANLSKILPWSDCVFINCSDLEVAQKVLSCPSIWPDRFPLTHYLHESAFGIPYGLFFGGGAHHKCAHRLVLRLLHQFEFFKPSKVQQAVQFEAFELEAELEKLFGTSGNGRSVTFSPSNMFKPYTLNVVSQVIMSHRFPRSADDDPKAITAESVLRSVDAVNTNFDFPSVFLEAYPWLNRISRRLTCFRHLYSGSHYLYGIFREIIAEKRSDRSPAEPRDLVDGILLEVGRIGGGGVGDDLMNEDNLLVVMRDMIFGGSDTINSSLSFALLFLSLQTDVQHRVQAEIDQVLGFSRTPMYSDKARMPYTEAVLLEVLRLSSPLPATARAADRETELCGTRIKRGSMLVINIYGIHRSDQVWNDPSSFRPERFLSPAGYVINKDRILPFGLGRRSCTAEVMANVSLFILLVAVLQKFSFRISPNHPLPLLENPVALSRFPPPYYVEMFRRNFKNDC